jgi:hypothetical protein
MYSSIDGIRCTAFDTLYYFENKSGEERAMIKIEKPIHDLEKPQPKERSSGAGSDFRMRNTSSFRHMVKYISSLRQEGIINDDDFANLLVYSCSIFIENEFESLLQRTVLNRFSTVS